MHSILRFIYFKAVIAWLSGFTACIPSPFELSPSVKKSKMCSLEENPICKPA